MTEIATPGQLRMSYLRWALVTVPAIVLIGSLMGVLSNSGYGNRWFASLDLPAITPPGWVFGVVWPILYIMLGLSLAMILHARGAKGRGLALTAVLCPADRQFRLVAAVLRPVSGDERALSDHLHPDDDDRHHLCLCPDPQGGGVAAGALYGLAQLCRDPEFSDRPAQSRRRNPCPHRRQHPDRVTARDRTSDKGI